MDGSWTHKNQLWEPWASWRRPNKDSYLERSRYSEHSLHFLPWDFETVLRYCELFAAIEQAHSEQGHSRNKMPRTFHCRFLGVGDLAGFCFWSSDSATTMIFTVEMTGRRWNEISWTFWPHCLTIRLGELSSLEPCRCRVNRMNGKMDAECGERNEESFLFETFFSVNYIHTCSTSVLEGCSWFLVDVDHAIWFLVGLQQAWPLFTSMGFRQQLDQQQFNTYFVWRFTDIFL